MSKLYQVGINLLPAVAYGDAAGLAGENMTAAEIANTFGTIAELRSPINRKIFQVEPRATVGTWSDDTELTLAVADSLITSGSFDLRDQAEHLLQAYNAATKVMYHNDDPAKNRMMPRGWGNNTTTSIERYQQGISPAECGAKDADTNGVLMKLAPLVYWQNARQTTPEIRQSELDSLTKMTHDSADAVMFSRVHADVLHHLLDRTGDTPSPKEFSQFAMDRALLYEAELQPRHKVSEALNYLMYLDTVSFEDVLQNTDGKGFRGDMTLAVAYGFFLSGHNYTERVYAAANGGGDSDSIASIAGTMSLFSEGRVDFPPDVTMLHDYKILRQKSAELTRVAMA